MDGMLKIGQELKSENGFEYTVAKKLGEGGQGEVYEVNQGQNIYALKWYFPNTATADQKKIIENLIKRGEPSNNFLWPKDLLILGEGFGYIMPLRPSGYKGIVDMMKRRADPTFHALCVAGVNIAAGYQKLHSMGYSYRDISFGNIFFDPEKGDVLICDNDNVSVDGMCDSGVSGTPRFMAPEIVTGEKNPSTDTDLFSMAVLLFYMFMLHHPLEGKIEANIKCLDALAMHKLYGTSPVFIWDPVDKTNRPVQEYQNNAITYWDVYPKFIKDQFIHAFTEGIKKPKKRIVEKVWQDGFVRLMNSIIICQKCSDENFFDQDKINTGTGHICWRCQASLQIPPTIGIGKNLIFLNKDAKLLQHHIKEDYDLKTVVGEVVQNPNDPNKWGIRNVSNEVWVFTKVDGLTASVDKGKTAPISIGAKINFGNAIEPAS